MVWTTEEKKEYNRFYYETNRDNIIKKGCQVVICEVCKRKISFNGYNRHLKTKLCVNTSLKNKMIKHRLDASLPDETI